VIENNQPHNIIFKFFQYLNPSMMPQINRSTFKSKSVKLAKTKTERSQKEVRRRERERRGKDREEKYLEMLESLSLHLGS
jgi:hypothetical protein